MTEATNDSDQTVTSPPTANSPNSPAASLNWPWLIGGYVGALVLFLVLRAALGAPAESDVRGEYWGNALLTIGVAAALATARVFVYRSLLERIGPLGAAFFVAAEAVNTYYALTILEPSAAFYWPVLTGAALQLTTRTMYVFAVVLLISLVLIRMQRRQLPGPRALLWSGGVWATLVFLVILVVGTVSVFQMNYTLIALPGVEIPTRSTLLWENLRFAAAVALLVVARCGIYWLFAQRLSGRLTVSLYVAVEVAVPWLLVATTSGVFLEILRLSPVQALIPYAMLGATEYGILVTSGAIGAVAFAIAAVIVGGIRRGQMPSSSANAALPAAD